MIKHGIGLISGVALALAAVTLPGPASMASPAEGAAAASAPVAWVVNQSLHSAKKGSVTPIDTATNTVITNIPVSRDAIAVALAPGGKTAYVALKADNHRGAHGYVVPVDTTTYRKGKPVRAGYVPVSMAITPGGKTLYVIRAGAPQIGLPQDVLPINTAANTAGKPIETGLQPTAVAITTGH
jgi:DNA-binding beta-propeller fold protein YncE